MTNALSCFTHLSDQELLDQVKALAAREREATARLIASLVELDSRRLYLGEGCSSLFTYCTQILRLSEHATYGRIEATRAARRFPIVLELLADGSITLTTVCLLSPHLTAENHVVVLAETRHKSKRAVEHIVAGLRPQPAVPSIVRKLPSPKTPEGPAVQPTTAVTNHAALPLAPRAPSPPKRPVIVAPLAPELYRIQFTMSREMHEKLRHAQNLLRHAIPNGDPAAVLDRALTLLVADLEKRKIGATTRPREAKNAASDSRYVPASVKREVWARGGGQCTFVGRNGRCAERGFLEYHHVVPYADGGRTTSENLELRCRAHNAYEAEMHFGPLFVRESRAPWDDRNSGRTELSRLDAAWPKALDGSY